MKRYGDVTIPGEDVGRLIEDNESSIEYPVIDGARAVYLNVRLRTEDTASAYTELWDAFHEYRRSGEPFYETLNRFIRDLKVETEYIVSPVSEITAEPRRSDTDEDLMEIIANAAQELRERGYMPTLTPMVSPVSGDEEDTRCRVTLTRNFTSGEKHD